MQIKIQKMKKIKIGIVLCLFSLSCMAQGDFGNNNSDPYPTDIPPINPTPDPSFPGDLGNNPQDNNPLDAFPIDQYQYVLALGGILLVLYLIRKKKRMQQLKKIERSKKIVNSLVTIYLQKK